MLAWRRSSGCWRPPAAGASLGAGLGDLRKTLPLDLRVPGRRGEPGREEEVSGLGAGILLAPGEAGSERVGLVIRLVFGGCLRYGLGVVRFRGLKLCPNGLSLVFVEEFHLGRLSTGLPLELDDEEDLRAGGGV